MHDCCLSRLLNCGIRSSLSWTPLPYRLYERFVLGIVCNRRFLTESKQVMCIIDSRVELHFSGLIGSGSHPDTQKIRIIGLLLKGRLHWQFEVWKKILQRPVLGCMFIDVKIKC